MSIFATEFPVLAKVDKAAFVAQVIAWIRGIDSSQVLDGVQDIDGNFGHIKSENGEELIFRELNKDGKLRAIGFRHDLPDSNNRLWRTEAVLRCEFPNNEYNFITFKTQCIALEPMAITDTPRKPYIIKSIINDKLSGHDGILTISDQPIEINDNEEGILVAKSVFDGNATNHLPILYVSAKYSDKRAIKQASIEKLAYELGGIAHVVVEPSRAFSFNLKELVGGANSYGGAIALIVPKHGIIQKFYVKELDETIQIQFTTCAQLQLQRDHECRATGGIG